MQYLNFILSLDTMVVNIDTDIIYIFAKYFLMPTPIHNIHLICLLQTLVTLI